MEGRKRRGRPRQRLEVCVKRDLAGGEGSGELERGVWRVETGGATFKLNKFNRVILNV